MVYCSVIGWIVQRMRCAHRPSETFQTACVIMMPNLKSKVTRRQGGAARPICFGLVSHRHAGGARNVQPFFGTHIHGMRRYIAAHDVAAFKHHQFVYRQLLPGFVDRER